MSYSTPNKPAEPRHPFWIFWAILLGMIIYGSIIKELSAQTCTIGNLLNTTRADTIECTYYLDHVNPYK